MTKQHRRAIINLVALTLFFLSGNPGYALKVQQSTTIELIEQSQLIVVAAVRPSTSPWTATVSKVLKGRLTEAKISFDCFSRREKDFPIFDAAKQYLLFLTKGEGGSYRCVSYGKQGVWPKTEVEWPYSQSHVSTLEVAIAAVEAMMAVLSETTVEAREAQLALKLEKDNSLFRTMTEEFLAIQPADTYKRIRTHMATHPRPTDVSK